MTDASDPPGPDVGDRAREGAVGARQVVILALGLGAAYLIGVLLWPFAPALLTSATLAALVYPAYERLEEWIGQRDVAALVGTAVLFFAVLIPLIALSLVLVDELRSGIEQVTVQMSGLLAPDSGVRRWLESAGGYLGLEPEEVSAQLGQQMEQVPSLLADRTLSFLSGLGGWLLQGGVALFTIFYLLRDGRGIVKMIRWLIPLDPTYTDRLLQRSLEVTYATMYGNVVVALVQGLLVGLAFWTVGIPAPVLWGTVVAVFALLPIVGAPIVWAPAGLILLYQERIGAALGLLAFGILVVSTIDNVLRAILVSGRAQLHPLIVLFSVLGAIFVFGAVGILIGPILFVVCLSLIETARLVLEPGATKGEVSEGGQLLGRVSLGTFRGGGPPPGDPTLRDVDRPADDER